MAILRPAQSPRGAPGAHSARKEGLDGMSTPMRTCPFCSQQIPAASQHCSVCGRSLAGVPGGAPAPAGAPPVDNKKTVMGYAPNFGGMKPPVPGPAAPPPGAPRPPGPPPPQGYPPPSASPPAPAPNFGAPPPQPNFGAPPPQPNFGAPPPQFGAPPPAPPPGPPPMAPQGYPPPGAPPPPQH